MSFNTRLSSIFLATLAIRMSWLTLSKNFSKIHIHHPSMAIADVPLGLFQGPVGASSRPKAEARRGEAWIEDRLDHLVDRLLDQTMQNCWHAQGSHALATWLGDVHPAHRCRFVASFQQRYFDGRPVVA